MIVVIVVQDQMLTISEAAKRLYVHPNTLRRWADKGLIKVYCISGRGDRRFTVKDIVQFEVSRLMYSKGSR